MIILVSVVCGNALTPLGKQPCSLMPPRHLRFRIFWSFGRGRLARLPPIDGTSNEKGSPCMSHARGPVFLVDSPGTSSTRGAAARVLAPCTGRAILPGIPDACNPCHHFHLLHGTRSTRRKQKPAVSPHRIPWPRRAAALKGRLFGTARRGGRAVGGGLRAAGRCRSRQHAPGRDAGHLRAESMGAGLPRQRRSDPGKHQACSCRWCQLPPWTRA